MKKIITIAISILLLLGLIPGAAFADSRQVTINRVGERTIQQGDSVYVTITSKANTDDPYMLELSPDSGLAIDTGYSGVITTTERVQINYKISAGENTKPGDYKVKVRAVDPNTKELLQEMIFTVEVEKASNSFSIIGGADANISYELSGGDALYVGDTNILTVTLFNRGTGTVRNAKISLVLPDGLSIESGVGTKAVGTFAPGATVSASFPIVCKKTITDGSYAVTVNIDGQSYTSGGDVSTSTMKEVLYLPVKNGKADQTLDVAKPILMVSDYSFGASAVQAGATFPLSLTLQNTSSVDLQNIKVTVNPASGAFIPVGSSNSFYIDKIEAKASVTRSLNLSSNIEIAQGSHSITVDCTYEDTDKNAYSASDVIAVPVVQRQRLVVDPVTDPGCMVGERAYASINYRNMGNSTINNLVIRVDGDFTMDTSNVYYVGNMASGKSDYYNWQFYPAEAGPLSGSVTFTYEDAAGNEHEYVQEFEFNVGEAWVPDFPIDEPMPEDPMSQIGSMPLWQKIAIPVLAAIAIIIIVKLVKRAKAKKQEALELDE